MSAMIGSTTKKDEIIEFNIARKDPTKFAYFSLLPCEIRLQIWSDARPEGRYIELKVSKSGTMSAVYSPAKIPRLLQACYESRVVALGWYKLAFATKYNQEMRTYFDSTRDGIYIKCEGTDSCVGGGRAIKNLLNDEGFDLIKRIVWEGSVSRLPLLSISHFRAVKDLIIIRGRRTSPRAEVTLAEMTINLRPLFRNNKSMEDHWRHQKEKLYHMIKPFFPAEAENLMALQSIARMDLPELAHRRKGVRCLACL